MEKVACFQGLLYIAIRLSSKQGLLVKQNLTFLLKFPVKECPLHGPPVGSLWTKMPIPEPSFTHLSGLTSETHTRTSLPQVTNITLTPSRPPQYYFCIY